jgi:hypothetical protein
MTVPIIFNSTVAEGRPVEADPLTPRALKDTCSMTCKLPIGLWEVAHIGEIGEFYRTVLLRWADRIRADFKKML